MISDYYLQTCKNRKKKVVKAVIIMINEEVELPIFSKFGETKKQICYLFLETSVWTFGKQGKKKDKNFQA